MNTAGNTVLEILAGEDWDDSEDGDVLDVFGDAL
jgi:hypothetical protein